MADTASAAANPPATGNDFQMQPLDLSCPAKKTCQDDGPEDYSVTRPREAPTAVESSAEETSPASASQRHPVYLLHRFKRPRSSDSSSDDRRTTSSGSPIDNECGGRSSHGPARKRFLTKFRREDDSSSAAATAAQLSQPSASSTPLPSRRHSDNAPGK